MSFGETPSFLAIAQIRALRIFDFAGLDASNRSLADGRLPRGGSCARKTRFERSEARGRQRFEKVAKQLRHPSAAEPEGQEAVTSRFSIGRWALAVARPARRGDNFSTSPPRTALKVNTAMAAQIVLVGGVHDAPSARFLPDGSFRRVCATEARHSFFGAALQMGPG